MFINKNHSKWLTQFGTDILVASRRCARRLRDLTPEETIDFFMTVCKAQRLMEQYYQTTSSTVTVQDGEFAGQTVRVTRFQAKLNNKTL